MSSQEKGATRVLAEFAAGLKYEDIPARVIERAKMHTLNILACALRGHTLESASIVNRVHKAMGGNAEAVVIGEGTKLPAAIAAGVNAHAAYSTMNDDTFFEAVMHPGHTAISAALATAEREEASGKDFLAAVVTGLEVGCRVGASLCQTQESNKARLGWHCNISDAFVGIGSAGKILDLNADQFTAGIGIAATSSSGLVETMNPPPSYVWPWDGGMNTYLSVLGAYLAKEGMTAGETALEGPQGYINMFTAGKAPPEAHTRVVRGLGEEWHTMDVGIKTRCASFMVHAAIEAAQRSVLNNGVEPQNIDTITIRSHYWTGLRLMGQEIKDFNDTVFSLPYAIGVAILDGGIMSLPDQHVAHLKDPRVYEIMAKISSELDPEIDKSFGAQMKAVAILKTMDGREFQERVDTAKGKYPERPLTDEEFQYKFRTNAGHSLDPKQIDKLSQMVNELESLDRVSELARLLQG